ncbi:MAG: hypothetical protein KatS3mg028_1637 [Bacteroidia bacterium]|nr:MAG: hypothetical protein KatS3mg028_1637 [Bacteroidia bacterium]
MCSSSAGKVNRSLAPPFFARGNVIANLKQQTMNKLLFAILVLTSCGQTTTQQETTSVQEASAGELTATPAALPQDDEDFIDSLIVYDIVGYYKQQYQDARMDSPEINEADSTINITFYNIPKNEDDYDGHLIAMSIPMFKTQYLFGDLNNDKVIDVVADVQTEGGGGGGNVWWNDIFVFLSNGKQYSLTSYNKSPDICGCKDGYFYPEKIENGLLKGNSSCYDWEKDAHCCPSLKYKTTVKFDGTQLVFVNKTETK